MATLTGASQRVVGPAWGRPPAQFREVCEKVLPKEGCGTDLAGYIADEVWAISGTQADLRQAVQVARIGGGDRGQVEEVLQVLKRHGFNPA